MKKLIVEIEKKVPPQFFQIFASIGFWNEEGEKTYILNLEGKIGNAFTQTQARKLKYEEFILNCLISDINMLTKDLTGFKFGKAGSHIWVSNDKNERILFIHF